MSEKKLRFAVAGVGDMGNGHIDGVQCSDYGELVALMDPAGPACLDRRRQYPECYKSPIPTVPIYTDYREMLDKEQLDCVIIAGPDAVHRDYAVMAMERGIHVLCEKPLTVTDEEAADIVAAEKKYGVRAFAGQICRFAPGFMLAKELLDAGEIGELFCVEAQYRHNCHANLAPDNWRRFPPRHATSCGGCHAIDIMRYFAGDPTEVFAMGTYKCRPDWPVEDTSESVFRLPNGVIGRVYTSLGSIAPYSMQTTLYGTEGTIETNNVTKQVIIHRPGGTQETRDVTINSHNAVMECNEMCRAILFGEKVSHEVIEGAKTLYCCNAAIRSIETGEKVVIDYSTLM
ncbi:MAG: Gfo/Idh/MocA family oxidoreductase [Clostridia bacterium]|nr:Gfo/Idh/MocA family oxidoreductase [Clostridia bacterium]